MKITNKCLAHINNCRSQYTADTVVAALAEIITLANFYWAGPQEITFLEFRTTDLDTSKIFIVVVFLFSYSQVY